MKKVGAGVGWGLNLMSWIAIPSTVGLYILAEPIVVLIYYRGAFDSNDVVMTANSLKLMCFSIPFLMWIKVLASSLYARCDVRTPVGQGFVL